MKTIVSASISQELIDWIGEKVKDGTFRSRSHGIEKSIADEKARGGN